MDNGLLLLRRCWRVDDRLQWRRCRMHDGLRQRRREYGRLLLLLRRCRMHDRLRQRRWVHDRLLLLLLRRCRMHDGLR